MLRVFRPPKKHARRPPDEPHPGIGRVMAVASPKMGEYRKQCWRLAGLVRNGTLTFHPLCAEMAG